MVYTLRFSSSKCSLFHNFKVFGSCIIHVLYTGVLKLKKKSVAKWLIKKQDVEVDIPASNGVVGNYLKYVSFPWPPRKAALIVFNATFLI